MRDFKASASTSSSKYKSGKALKNMKKKSENLRKSEESLEVDKAKDEKSLETKCSDEKVKAATSKPQDSDHESVEEFEEQPATLTENTDSYDLDTDEDDLRKFEDDSSGRKGRNSHDNTPDFEGLILGLLNF